MIQLVAILSNARAKQSVSQCIAELPDFHLAGCFPSLAAAALAAPQPQVVLVDISADPTILAQIKRNQYGEEIIALISTNDRAALPSALRLGIADCLVKPFSATRLYYALTFLQKRIDKKAPQTYSQQQLDEVFLRLDGVGGIARALQKTDKGVSPFTLQRIWNFLQQSSSWHTIADLAKQATLSHGAICKYLRYLQRQGLLRRRFRQGAHGRPRLEVMAFEPFSNPTESTHLTHYTATPCAIQ